MKPTIENIGKNAQIMQESTGDIYLIHYGKIIAKKSKGCIFLDETYYRYSQTTSKHRCNFLNERLSETEKKIASGEYKLTNLN